MCYYLVLVSEMSIKRLLLMIVSENEALRVIAVGYAVYDEPPRKLHQRL